MTYLLKNQELLDNEEKQKEYLCDKYGNTVRSHPSTAYPGKWYVYKDISVGHVEYIAVGNFQEIIYNIIKNIEGSEVSISHRKITFIEDENALQDMNNKNRPGLIVLKEKSESIWSTIKRKFFG